MRSSPFSHTHKDHAYLDVGIRVRPVGHHGATQRHDVFGARGRDAAGVAARCVICHLADVGCGEGDGDCQGDGEGVEFHVFGGGG